MSYVPVDPFFATPPTGTYQFVKAGKGGVGSDHCTYCPMQPGEACVKPCGQRYTEIEAERAADGCCVIDIE